MNTSGNIRPLTLAISYDSLPHYGQYEGHHKVEAAWSSTSVPQTYEDQDIPYEPQPYKPESILRKTWYKPAEHKIIPPSDISEEQGAEREEVEDIEKKLLETITAEQEYTWRKVKIRFRSETPWYARFFQDSKKQTNVERLIFPSEEKFSYKVTKIYEAESFEEDDQSSQSFSLYSFPPWESEDNVVPSSPASPTGEITPILSTIFLDNRQVKKLTSLLNLGIDIDNSVLVDLLEPIDVTTYYELEAIVSANSLVPIKKMVDPPNYPVDKTPNNPVHVTKLVSKYIENVLALNPTPCALQWDNRHRFIKAMKPLVLPMSEVLKKSNKIENFGPKVYVRGDTPDEICKTDVTGYRNKMNNVTYYNACSQTYRPHDHQDGVFVSREAQTPVLPLQDKLSSTMESKSTQMERDDYYIDNARDRIICPKPYQKHIHGPALLAILATKIQRTWREYLINQRDTELKSALVQLQKNEKKKRFVMQESVCVRQMRAMLSPMYLNKREDCHMLYLFLENWWKIRKENEEHKNALCILQNLKRTSCNDLNKALASRVLKQEYDEFLKYLMNIERLITEAKARRGDIKDLAELKESTNPLTIPAEKRGMVTISTVESRRGTFLQSLYEALRRRDQTVRERVEFLHQIQQFILQEHKELQLTDRLCSLIKKEMDYLKHFIRPEKIETLRQRIELHFLKYITSGKVNPNMKKILDKRCPPDSGPSLLRCEHCLKVQNISYFETECFSDNVLPVCKACHHVYVIANKFEDHSKYTSLLEFLRQEEIKYCTLSPVPFLINEATVHYLVFNIWGSQSAISNSTDIIQLRLARWIIHLDWTPWNNIVLTEEEYESHVNVRQVYSFYSSTFIRKVQLRNKRAKMHFENLYKLEFQMKSMFWLQGDEGEGGGHEDYEECILED